MSARRFNWEAALVPCWGWLRRVPIAQWLSLPFPFVVIAVLGTERTLYTKDLVIGFAVPSVLYGALYGLAGDWMLRKSREKKLSTAPEPRLTVGRVIWHVIFTAMMLAVAFVIVIAAIASNHGHESAVRGAMKADLRNLVTAQEAHLADFGRYASTLDSLEFQPSSNISVSLVHGDSSSFAAEASYRNVAQRCRISIGKWAGAPVDSLDGVLVCDEDPVAKH